MSKNFIMIKFCEPIENLYRYNDACPPKARGEGCYGDCYDCYARDRDRYKKIKLFQEQKK